MIYVLVVVLGELNGHVGRHFHRFDCVRVEYGECLTNFEGRMLLELFLG